MGVFFISHPPGGVEYAWQNDEIKEKKQHCVFLKQQALKDAGYTCEIWVFDSKGNIVNKLI